VGRTQRDAQGQVLDDCIDPQGSNGKYALDPQQAAQAYFDRVSPVWEKSSDIKVWQPLNECDGFFDWQSDFYIALMKLAETKGLRLALYGSSAGNPRDTDSARQMIPALQYAKQRGHYLALHEYGFDSVTLKASAPNLALRYRSLYETVLIPNNADPPLILTEVGPGVGGVTIDPNVWLEDLRWYDSELMKDDYVVGASIYQLGGSENIMSVLPALGDYIADPSAPIQVLTTATPDAVTELFARTNALRADNKLSPYTLNTDLNQVALAHSQDMAAHDFIDNVGTDGSTDTQRITAAGYGAGKPAENLYVGPDATVDAAWSWWLNSPVHRDNFLSSVNTDMGIGVAQNITNTYYTIVFGKPTQSTVKTSTPDPVAELLVRTNALRLSNKLPPYTLNADLNQVALAHSQDMATRDQLTDIGTDGSTAAQRITAAGYGVGQPAEAICSGQGETAESAWAKLTANSSDQANLLNAVNTDVGIGVAQNQSTTYYTLVFGKPAQSRGGTPQTAPTSAPLIK